MSAQLPHKSKAIVIGGGIIGAAVFYELCRVFDGDVRLLEKSRFARGATGWSAGIVRGYHSDDELFKRGCRSAHYYNQFRVQHTSLHFNRTGLMYFEPSDHEEQIKKRLSDQMAAKLDLRWMQPTDEAKCYSPINWQGTQGAVFEATSGYFDPHAVTMAFVEGGRARGGHAMEGIAAATPIVDDGKILGVETNIGACVAPLVILCTGAWSEKLSGQWGLSLPLYAKTIQMNSYLVPPSSDTHPIFIDDSNGLYGRGNGLNSILMGKPVGKPCTDPDKTEPLDLLHARSTLNTAKSRFTWASEAILDGGFRAFDAYTDDGRGLIQAHADLRGLFIASGFSGGGFKQAPAVAMQIVDLINQYQRAA